MPMSCPRLALIVIASLTTAYAAYADADKAKELFRSGQALVAAGDFAAGLTAYEAAAAADSEDLNYQVAAAVLKRVISLRETLPRLAETPKWTPAVKALYAFCMENHAYAEALNQAAALHAKQADGESAAMVARANLRSGDNDAAIAVIAALPADMRTNETWVLTGIAQARLGNAEKAAAAARAVRETEHPDPALLYDRACLHSLLGDLEIAADCLTRAFENTLPSRLDVLKGHARTCGDLAQLRERDTFAKALATASKVSESNCSGGTSCAQCPSKGTCDTGGTHKTEQKKP